MKCYVIKSKDGHYVSNRGKFATNIIDAILFEGAIEAKAHKNMLNNYHPEDDWKIILINIEEVAEVI